MILYFIPAEKRYVHRLSDVPKGVEPKKVDVPTDLQGLMGFLNELWAAHQIDLDLAKNTVDFSQLRPEGAPINMEGEPGVLNLDPLLLEEPVVREMTVAEAVRQIEELEVPTISAVVNLSTKPDLAALIMETEPGVFGPVLSATLERLGELRKEGTDGLRQFLRGNTAAERGIGALFVETFGGQR